MAPPAAARASQTPPRGVGRRLQDGLAQAASRRLGPDCEIDAWTLKFVNPHVETGFLQRYRDQLRSSLRTLIIVTLCGLPVMLYFWLGEDVSEYPTQDVYDIRRWQSIMSVACVSTQLLSLIAAVVLSHRGLIAARGMENWIIFAMIVAEVHACVRMKHYFARAFGWEDPSVLWGLDLAGSDSTFLLSLALCIVASGMMVRWKRLVPLAWLTVLGYAAAAYLLGGPDMRLAPINLLLFAFIASVTCWCKRCSEYQARLLHLSYLREKQMRFSAEFSLECMKDRQDVECHAVDSSYYRQVHADAAPGAPPAGASRRSLRSAPSAPLSAPAWFGPAAPAGLAGACRPAEREAGDEADGEAAPQCSDCLPLDAGVWVEGWAEPCALRDLERGQRVLCYDSLGESLRYAEVLEKQVDFREVPWVAVGLDDGTQLEMTADHPVQPANRREVVRAAELDPGSDSVVVHRVVTDPVAVREVSWLAETPEQPRGRAYLAVRQPDRHLILVAGAAGPQRHTGSMAVCSADVAAVAARRHLVSTRGTFLHVHAGEPPEGALCRPRPRSEPPRLPSEGRRAGPAEAPKAERKGPSEVTPSTLSSSDPLSGASDASGQAVAINVSMLLEPGSADEPRRPVARVSEWMTMRRMGWPSLGSKAHARGDCRLCDYHKKGSCRAGPGCHHCHVDYGCGKRRHTRPAARPP